MPEDAGPCRMAGCAPGSCPHPRTSQTTRLQTCTMEKKSCGAIENEITKRHFHAPVANTTSDVLELHLLGIAFTDNKINKQTTDINYL